MKWRPISEYRPEMGYILGRHKSKRNDSYGHFVVFYNHDGWYFTLSGRWYQMAAPDEFCIIED